MNTSILNFTFVKTPKTKFSDEQVLLREFTGKSFSRAEAARVWAKVLNHKWNMSRDLKRDVGFRVAAIDFVENFYAPPKVAKVQPENSIDLGKLAKKVERFFRSYFRAKGKTLNY